MDIPTGEDALLAIIDRHFPNLPGIGGPARGDDCAVLAGPDALLVSTDLFFEDVHFRTGYFLHEEIGHKALAVNISDIAAMGGRPLHFSMGLGLPQGISLEFFSSLCSGIALLAAEHGLFLSGGDLSASERLLLSITITGTYWPETGGNPPCFLKRAVARPGDAIFCVGAIGLACVGLALLESRGRAAIGEFPAACAAHLKPMPLVNGGRCLALAAKASGEADRFGLMDVSDGLARDLEPLGLTAAPGDVDLGGVQPDVWEAVVGVDTEVLGLLFVHSGESVI